MRRYQYQEKRSNPFVHVIWAAVLVIVLVLGFRVFTSVSGKAEHLARQMAAMTEEAAAKFKSGSITQTFQADFPVFQSAGLGRLGLGTSEAVESFRQSDSRRVLWDTVSLGDTVSEIRVPVTYRYNIPLDGDWRLRIEGKTCVVETPQVQPSLPPAIHTDRMEKMTSSGWARFDKVEQLDALERSVTPRLSAYASDPAHFNRVREECRLTVARFVRAWLLREDQWRDDKLTSVVVIFPDEPSGPAMPTPTLEYQEKP